MPCECCCWSCSLSFRKLPITEREKKNDIGKNNQGKEEKFLHVFLEISLTVQEEPGSVYYFEC